MLSSGCRVPFVFMLPAINSRNKSSENAHLKMMLLRRSSRQTFSSSLHGKRLQHMEMYHQTSTSNTNLFLSSFIRHQFQITNRMVPETVKCETTCMNPLIDLWHMISMLTMKTKGFMPFLQNLDDAWSSLLDWSLPFETQAIHHLLSICPDSHLSRRPMSANSKSGLLGSVALRVALVRNCSCALNTHTGPLPIKNRSSISFTHLPKYCSHWIFLPLH